ncbi:MAG TPA: NrtA/SsuA/CpmA family ABC transporter substrate-binding protein [Trebonia sp.]|jgi:sulfonate transport system substrate-binding protein
MTRSKTRRGLAAPLAGVAVTAVAVVAAGCSSSASTPANAITPTSSASAAAAASSGTSVTVRIPDPGNSGVLAEGKKDGSLAAALAKVGAKVAWTGTAGPFAPAAIEMAANQLDFAQGSITSAVTSLAATPVFELFAQQRPDKLGEGILVNSDSPIKSVKDLVGKSVAVNKGGTGEYLLRKALAAAGIPVSKVNLVYLNPAQTAPVLNSGKVSAWATWSTYSVAEVGLDNARFVETGGEFGSENYSVWAVRTAFAKQYPQVVAAFYNYLHAEGLKLVADPDEFINVFQSTGAQALNPAEETFDAKDSAALGTTDPITAGIATQFQSVASFFAAQGVTKSAITVAPYIIQPGSTG